MIRQEPPADWIAYLIVGVITLCAIIWKYTIMKDDKKNDQSQDN
jgi:hypothetical protein